jgi:hypothetical protein
MASGEVDPATNCTEFISTLYDDARLFTNTEYETADALRYNTYLARMGSLQGFNLPSARAKAEIIATMMISYKRAGRIENVTALVGHSKDNQGSTIATGVLPFVPAPAPAALQTMKKKHWWSRG